MKTLRHKIRTFVGVFPKAGLLTALFVVVLALLMVALWFQVRQATDIALPTGRTAALSGLDMIPSRDSQALLVLNSYHYGYSWSDNEMEGIVDTLSKSGRKLDLHIEYLDCKHFPEMEHFDRLRDLFREKYRSSHFPVVIAADNPALLFALRYRPQLFPQAAVIFCGINGFSPRMLEGQADVTGVAELLDAAGTLEIALRNHPRTREVFVVHDYSITGLSTRRETETQLRRFAGRVRIRYLENMTTDELMRAVRKLPADSLVLALSYSLDKAGQVINHEQISRLLSENSPVPVYGLHEERLGYGIVGGSLLGGRLQGERAAELALKVLEGVPASSLPVDLKSPTRPMFDYVQLKRFGIPDSSLPPESIIVNRPVSFLSAYPGLVLTTLAIILVLASGILALGVNIYRRRIAEEEQLRLQGQLIQAQKMEAVGHLAGGVAHDFNNILTAIIGYANLVRKRVPDGDMNRTFLDQILGASKRAAALVKNLLAFSRKQVIEPVPTDLNDIVTGVEKIIRRLIGEDIELAVVLRGGTVNVLADTGQIEQVVLNLCTNARDAMPRGGRLTIETDRVPVGRASLEDCMLDRPGDYGRISVSDTGIGMDEAVQRKIFEPFFTTKEVGRGTGLGLSMAYGILRQHNGSVAVTSEPGKGTTFRIYLPVVASSARREANGGAGPSPRGRETILLAEDEPDVRTMAALVLRDAGYTVIEAKDGEDAVALFRTRTAAFDLLLTDMIMPKKNGQEVYDLIKTDGQAPRVLFISGYTADMMERKGILRNGDPFLAKPLTPDQLLRAVRQVLDGEARPS